MTNKRFLLPFILLFSMMLIFSCTKVENNTPQAPVDPVAKFLGTWHVADTAAQLNYDVIISRHSVYPKTKVYLNNFADFSGRIEGEVVGNTILLHNQPTSDSHYIIDDGTGTWISDKKLDFLYTLNDGIDTKVCEAVFTK